MTTFPAPRCRFPAPGSPAGSCVSYTNSRRSAGLRRIRVSSRRGLRTMHGDRPAFLSPTGCRARSGPGSFASFTRACDAFGIPALRTGSGQATSRQPSFFRYPSNTRGPLPRPALSGVPNRAGLSVTPPTRPSRASCWRPPTGPPVLPRPPCVPAITPAGPVGAPATGFPTDVSLLCPAEGRHPHCSCRSLLDVHSRSGPHGRCAANAAPCRQGLLTGSLPPQPALAAANRSDRCWAGFTSARKMCLSMAHAASASYRTGVPIVT